MYPAALKPPVSQGPALSTLAAPAKPHKGAANPPRVVVTPPDGRMPVAGRVLDIEAEVEGVLRTVAIMEQVLGDLKSQAESVRRTVAALQGLGVPDSVASMTSYLASLEVRIAAQAGSIAAEKSGFIQGVFGQPEAAIEELFAQAARIDPASQRAAAAGGRMGSAPWSVPSQRVQRAKPSAIRELLKASSQPGVISFAGGFPDPNLFDVEGIWQSVEAVFKDNPRAVLTYGKTEGYEPLREEIARRARLAGAVGVRAEDVVVTTGSQQVLDLVAKCYVDEGSPVVAERPTFLGAIEAFRMYGAQILGVRVDGQGMVVDDLDALLQRMHEHGAMPKFIYVISNFGNPSGATMSLARREQLLATASRWGVGILEDNPYGQLVFGGRSQLPTLLALSKQGDAASSRLVAYCESLSKVLCPGLRIGWLIGSPEVVGNAVKSKQSADTATSQFTQAVAWHYLTSGRMEPALERVRAAYASRAQTMVNALRRHLGDAIEFTAPEGGLFIWARLTGRGGAMVDALELAGESLRRGVAVVPGIPFFDSDPDPATFRMCFSTVDEAMVEKGIAIVADVILGRPAA